MDQSNYKICVIGLGFVGLSLARLFSIKFETEYVLAATLISVAIAVSCGLLIKFEYMKILEIGAKGCFILAGINEHSLLQAVDVAV